MTIRRLIAPTLFLLPLLLLAAWLFSSQIAVWTAPRGVQFGASPAACESADLLIQLAGQVGGTPGLPEAQAREIALTTARAQFPADPTSSYLPDQAYLNPVSVLWQGERRGAWLAAVPLLAARTDASGLPLPVPSAVLLLDGTTGDPFLVSLSPGTGDPADAATSCAFDARGSVADMVRSAPFLLLVAYLAGVALGGGIAFALTRWRHAGRRGDGQPRKARVSPEATP